MHPPTHSAAISLCSGIGAFDRAIEQRTGAQPPR